MILEMPGFVLYLFSTTRVGRSHRDVRIHGAIVTDGCELLSEEACRSGAWLDSWLQHDFSDAQSSKTPRQSKTEHVQWNVLSACTYNEQLTLLVQHFKGNQIQPFCTLSLLGQTLFREAELRAVGDSDQTLFTAQLRKQGRLVRMPRAYLTTVFRKEIVRHVISPASLSRSLHVEPVAPQAAGLGPGAGQVPALAAVGGPGGAEPADSAEPGPEPPAPVEQVEQLPGRTSLQEILLAQLGYRLSSTEDMDETLQLTRRILFDMLRSLSQRFVNEPGCSSVRRARYLSADASPQGGHDYLCILEEIASRSSSWVPDAEEGQFNPFKGFDQCVRALPCQTLARGQTKVPMKVACLLNSILMEHGVDKLQHYRQEVRGWVSDQGTERAISKYPLRDGLAVLGKPLRLDMEGHDLPADVVGRGGEASRPFFHSSLDVSGLMHVVYNALEAAVTGQRHWPKFQKQLRAICKLCGEKSYQEVVANQMLRAAGASALDIQMLCAFNAKHLDWHWETLETVLAQWSPLRPVLQQYFKADMLEATDSGLALLVSQALQSPWHGLMLEWLRGLTEAVGKETRWMEGCYCHEAVLVGTGSRWKRRHQMLGATGAVTCPWKGKWLPSFALGHREAMTRSLDLAGSSEYHRALLNGRCGGNCRHGCGG